MSATVLQSCQSALRYEEGPLYCLEADESKLTSQTFDSLATPTEREQARSRLEETDPSTRIFFISHIFEHLSPEGTDPRKVGVMRFTVGISLDGLAWLFQHQKVHPALLESLHSQCGTFAVYETLDAVDKPSYLHICVKVAPAGHLEAAFYIQYDYTTKRIVAIVAGNDLSSHLKHIVDSIQRQGPFQDPFSLAGLLVTQYFRFLEAQKVQVDHAVIMTERETGRGAVAYSGGQTAQIIAPDKFDLTFMHWIEGNQRNIVYAADTQVKLATFLIEEHMQYIQRRNSVHFDRHKLTAVERAVHERLKSHRTFVEGLLSASLVIRERIQRQLSAADSIINQSDNKVSLSNAEANTKIAEQSKKIAEETRRDSTSMKTIASLTMVYLPSTFAATVFGTGFFTYEVNGKTAFHVSSQIWTLIVVGVALSVLTVGIWIWINKFGIPMQLNWARQQNENTKYDEETGLPLSNLNKTGRPPLTVVSAPKLSLPVRPVDEA